MAKMLRSCSVAPAPIPLPQNNETIRGIPCCMGTEKLALKKGSAIINCDKFFVETFHNWCLDCKRNKSY